ncbi:hypothetical protein SmJEL517_g04318 [Synchytrium microbalum]|uniref:Timeless N-terminal domain-containing protein n=1 Tax=Synchytrium microbalum TaxID=1806994 RepID=A0A507BSJ3_9FUNG|nr:uncharacterized protein SmJEL517_g04318 [Synchytrium microbalum]TPX32580.1 hypothetical protein SmJEL517_g04318 [Synchytrium microbalum]
MEPENELDQYNREQAQLRDQDEDEEELSPEELEFLQQQRKKELNHLLNICAALGGYEEVPIDTHDGNQVFVRKYMPGAEAIDCLRDIRRFLKHDVMGKEMYISIQLGRWQILQKDLLPMFMSDETDEKLRRAILDLFAPMTWEINPKTKNIASQKAVLREYKIAFLGDGVLRTFRNELLVILGTEDWSKHEKNIPKLRLLLNVIRNVLSIKDDRVSVFSSTEAYMKAHLQEQLVLQMKDESILEFIITFAASMGDPQFAQWNMLIMEIVYFLFRDRDPEELVTRKEKIVNTILEDSLKEDDERKRRVAGISSRHSRFGGTLSLQLGNGRTHNVHSTTVGLKDVDKALNLGKAAQKGPTGKKPTIEKDYDAKIRVLNQRARDALADSAELFLDQAFNALMMSVKKDFDREASKVREEDHTRFLRLVTFYLKYIILYREKKGNKYDFDCVAGLVDDKGMQYVCKRMHMYLDEKNYTGLQSALDCLKQMLVVLDAMAVSPNEVYREASVHTQDVLFYEGMHVQALAALCKVTRVQSQSYLETLIESVHVFLTMMENYSKNKDFLVMKKKTHGGGKRKADPENMNYEEDDAEIRKARFAEREMKFLDIERDFTSDNVVLNYCALLSHYQTCDDRFLLFIATMFHRIFVKCKMEAYFYRLSVIELFHRILNDRGRIRITKGFKEVHTFAKYVSGKLIKRLQENPILFIHMFYPKRGGDSSRFLTGVGPSYTVTKKTYEGPYKFGVPFDQKLKVAVLAVADAGHKEFLEWIVQVYASACTNRKDDEFDAAAAKLRGEEAAVLRDFELKGLDGQSDDFNHLLSKNNLVRMLLNLLGLERLEVDDFILWIIPKKLSTSNFNFNKALLEEFMEEDTNMPDGKKDLAKLIHKKTERKSRSRPQATARSSGGSSSSSSNGGSSSSEAQGADAEGRKKRKKDKKSKRPHKRRKTHPRKNDDEEQRRELSAMFIIDSDDEDDEAFFAREAALRAKILNQRTVESEQQRIAEEKGLAERAAKLAERKAAIQARAKTSLGSDDHNSNPGGGSQNNNGEDDEDATPTTTQTTKKPTPKSGKKKGSSSASKKGKGKTMNKTKATSNTTKKKTIKRNGVVDESDDENGGDRSSSSSSDDEQPKTTRKLLKPERHWLDDSDGERDGGKPDDDGEHDASSAAQASQAISEEEGDVGFQMEVDDESQQLEIEIDM